jgi:hypothetical protein
MQKEIYFFRTILQKEKERRAYLENRLAEINRQLYQSMGELILKPYKGSVPSNYYPDDPTSDPGFEDLTGDQYFKYRVENQLVMAQEGTAGISSRTRQTPDPDPCLGRRRRLPGGMGWTH